jgi:hypothetical protein
MNTSQKWSAGLLISAIMAIAAVLPAAAQTSLTQTTLAAAMGSGNSFQTTMSLASATGVVTAVNNSPVTIAYVDTEAIGILTLQQGQTTVFNVLRGQYGTKVETHAANAVVYLQIVTPDSGGFSGAGGLEISDPPVQGGCVAANTLGTPWINMTTGQQWVCAAYNTPAGNSQTGWIPGNLSTSPNTNAPLTVYVASAYTNATTTFSNVTGLSFYAQPHRNYQATCAITWQGSASTTGPKYEFTGPSSPTAVAVGMRSAVTSTSVLQASAVAFSSGVANSGTITATTNFTDTVTLGVVNGANGGVIQLLGAANGTGTLTIQPGSYCVVQ